ncbi:MAG: hypothetical protein U1A22_00820 [Xanthomonadaceae bacterium]|nr:hypothetical protein [Xanthomonadaceae bacterium]
MREVLTAATEAAIRSVDAARFFRTERGFHGRFYCALQAELDNAGLIANGAILEMEYQKSARHKLGQRPDIIFHIPTEHSHAGVEANNFAVWALKRRASVAEVREDFDKLDQMFERLHYPLGFFVNVDATDPMRAHYSGTYGSRLATVAASLHGAQVGVHWGKPDADA